jgi:hypothetical protein
LQENIGGHGGSKMKDIDSYMGDEPELEQEQKEQREAYEDDHCDDWKDLMY